MFANGSEHDSFEMQFCSRCDKCDISLDRESSCETQRKIYEAMFDKNAFPHADLILCGRSCRYICKNFVSGDPKLQEAYLRAVKEADHD